MAERPKLSGRQIKELFYTEVPDDKRDSAGGTDGSKMTYRCRCGKLRTQSLKHGYTNLAQHVHVKHPEWVAAIIEDSSVVPKLAAALQASPTPAAATQKSSKRGPRSTTKADGRNGRASASDDSASADASVPQSPAVDASPAPVPSSLKQSETEVTPAKPRLLLSAKTTPVQQQPLVSTAAVLSAAAAAAPPTVQKRADYLSWDDYFMSVAFLSAMRSKDPSTQVGACIVNPEKKIVGIGYNGFPNGCNDDELPWARSSITGSPLDTKYPYVCHAEMNAILNKNSTDVKGCTIYVALFPCNECAKLIIQSGITRVVYYSDKYNGDWKFEASRRLLDMAKVTYHQHRLQVSELLINFASAQ